MNYITMKSKIAVGVPSGAMDTSLQKTKKSRLMALNFDVQELMRNV